jgi:DNA-binding response OmpR family regulator
MTRRRCPFMSDKPDEQRWLAPADELDTRRPIGGPIEDDRVEPPASRSPFYAGLGGKPIALDYVEYRIFQLLSSRPYHAFTPRRIAEEVTSEEFPVTAESLPDHIASLRKKLGFFSDYIQSVPHIGYRFKE